jgi:hypothetical protein
MGHGSKRGARLQDRGDVRYPFLISDDQLRGKTTIDRILGRGDITRLIGG